MSRTYWRHLLYSAVVFSHFLIITGESPPNITKQPPAGELLFEVGNINITLLECEAKGEPAPEYRWTKDGETFDWKNKSYIIPKDNGTLSFNFSGDAQKYEGVAGRYQCFANNTFGTATSNSVTIVESTYLFKQNQTDTMNLTAVAGEPFSITCNSIPTGRPKPKLDWIIEDSSGASSSVYDSRITVDPYGTLWFSHVTLSDSNYTYKFAPTSGRNGGREVRCPTRLNVTQPNQQMNTETNIPKAQFVTAKNERVVLGQDIELFCIYSGNPLPETHWFKNGMPVNYDDAEQGNFNKSLFISSARTEDAGTYTCNVSNGVGPAESHDIELDVLEVPRFIVTPEFVEKTTGETAVIRCSASGNPKPAIEWLHNGKPIISEVLQNPRRTVTSESVTITALNESDIGNYGCNASNNVGYVYKDVYINILNSSLSNTNYLMLNGTSVIIGCKLFGSSTPSVKWTRNNVEIIDERYSTLENGGLRISEVDFADAGIYSCTWNDSTEKISKILTVIEHTRVTVEPNVTEIVEGTSIALKCRPEVDSHSSNFTVSWFVNDKYIDFNGSTRFVKMESDVDGDPSLTVDNAAESDSGTYTCSVKTYFDEENATSGVNVIKRGLTQVTIEPNAAEIGEGTNFTLNCNVKVDSYSRNSIISWFANDKSIDFDNSTKFDKTNSSMTVVNAAESDSRTYTCSVKTDFDVANATARLTVRVSPKVQPGVTPEEKAGSGWLIILLISVALLTVVLIFVVYVMKSKRSGLYYVMRRAERRSGNEAGILKENQVSDPLMKGEEQRIRMTEKCVTFSTK